MFIEKSDWSQKSVANFSNHFICIHSCLLSFLFNSQNLSFRILVLFVNFIPFFLTENLPPKVANRQEKEIFLILFFFLSFFLKTDQYYDEYKFNMKER